MQSYCLKCWKNTETKNPKVHQRKNNAFIKMCSACMCSKKSKFIKDQEAIGLLTTLGITTPFFRGISQLIQDIKWMK